MPGKETNLPSQPARAQLSVENSNYQGSFPVMLSATHQKGSPRLICIARDLLIHIGQGPVLWEQVQYIWLSSSIYVAPSDYPKHTIIRISLGGQSIE